MTDEADFRIQVLPTSAVSVVRRVGEHCHDEEFVPFCWPMTSIYVAVSGSFHQAEMTDY